MQVIWGEAMNKFEKEFEASKLSPVFHFEWATALQTIGSDAHITTCLEQVRLEGERVWLKELSLHEHMVIGFLFIACQSTYYLFIISQSADHYRAAIALINDDSSGKLLNAFIL